MLARKVGFDMFKKLLNTKLVVKKDYGDLSVYKYSRKVFHDNLWNDELRLMRGLVLDYKGNMVALGFPKVFNYKENNAGLNVPLERVVHSYTKKNGFFLSAFLYNDCLMFGSTGSLDSDFVKMGESMFTPEMQHFICEELMFQKKFGKTYTMSFEICHEDDPHIIKEDVGVYFIGIRENTFDVGNFQDVELFNELKMLIPTEMKTVDFQVWTFGELLKSLKTCKHEGYLVYAGDEVFKIKSPYYLVTKFLARAKSEKLEMYLDDINTAKQRIKDEEFFSIVEFLSKNQQVKNDFLSMDEQERVTFCFNFFD